MVCDKLISLVTGLIFSNFHELGAIFIKNLDKNSLKYSSRYSIFRCSCRYMKRLTGQELFADWTEREHETNRTAFPRPDKKKSWRWNLTSLTYKYRPLCSSRPLSVALLALRYGPSLFRQSNPNKSSRFLNHPQSLTFYFVSFSQKHLPTMRAKVN